SVFETTDTEPENTVSFLAGRNKVNVVLNKEIDTAEEQKRLEKDLAYYQGFVEKVRKKLSNDRFVQNAPAPVVEKERQKLADGEMKIKSLEEALASLG
ncbi:MAG: valine--tRNA ligase, partial [Saprospiraceae bacterium]|nr:valine--tRNA ligase [Saprospiraceae bacterium]